MTKKRGIPECILLVTQRMTKYPLLIDTILKTTKGTENTVLMLVTPFCTTVELNVVSDVISVLFPETAPEISLEMTF